LATIEEEEEWEEEREEEELEKEVILEKKERKRTEREGVGEERTEDIATAGEGELIVRAENERRNDELDILVEFDGRQSKRQS